MGRRLAPLPPAAGRWRRGVLLVLALLALLAPVVAPYDPAQQFRREGLSASWAAAAPNSRFLLGTDSLGRDLLSRLLWGGRISLAIGVSATAIVMVIALIVGGIAGFAGAKTDFFADAPGRPDDQRPAVLRHAAAGRRLAARRLGRRLVVSLFGWPYPARVFRSQILSLKEADFVLAARVHRRAGAPHLLRHVLPHLLPLVTVYFALSMPGVIFAEASLSFLGLGVPPADPVVGLDDPGWAGVLPGAPWLVLYPGVAITLTVVSFNLVASGLREAMDPAQRGR